MGVQPAILLVDDEPSFLHSTAELLRNDGYRCDTAGGAGPGCELLASQWYDLIVADIRMPGNADLEFVEAVATMRPGVPVILITGYPSAGTAISSIVLPVVAYLCKPLQYGELRKHVARALTESEAFRTVAQAQERLRQMAEELEDVKHRRWARDDSPGSGAIRIPGSTLRALAATVAELVALEVAAGPKQHLARTCELLECARWPAHSSVIRAAVGLLNETKRRFKSKELAEVREMLEGLLNGSDAAG